MTAPKCRLVASLPQGFSPAAIRPVATVIDWTIVLRHRCHEGKSNPNGEARIAKHNPRSRNGRRVVHRSGTQPHPIRGTRERGQMPVMAVITAVAVMLGRMSVMPLVTVMSVMPMVLGGLGAPTPWTSPQPQACESTNNQRELLRHDGISGHRFDHFPARPGQEQPDSVNCTRHAKPQKLVFSRKYGEFPLQTDIGPRSAPPFDSPAVVKPRHLSSFWDSSRCAARSSNCPDCGAIVGIRDRAAPPPLNP